MVSANASIFFAAHCFSIPSNQTHLGNSYIRKKMTGLLKYMWYQEPVMPNRFCRPSCISLLHNASHSSAKEEGSPMRAYGSSPFVSIKKVPGHLHHAASPTSTNIATFPPLPLPLHPTISTSFDIGPTALGAHTARHTHCLADQPSTTTPGHPGAHANHAFDTWGQSQAEAGQKRSQRTARDEGQNDKGKDLDRVALRVVDEVAQEALELLVGAG